MIQDEKLMIRDTIVIGTTALVILWIALYLIDSRIWLNSNFGV